MEGEERRRRKGVSTPYTYSLYTQKRKGWTVFRRIGSQHAPLAVNVATETSRTALKGKRIFGTPMCLISRLGYPDSQGSRHCWSPPDWLSYYPSPPSWELPTFRSPSSQSQIRFGDCSFVAWTKIPCTYDRWLWWEGTIAINNMVASVVKRVWLKSLPWRHDPALLARLVFRPQPHSIFFIFFIFFRIFIVIHKTPRAVSNWFAYTYHTMFVVGSVQQPKEANLSPQTIILRSFSHESTRSGPRIKRKPLVFSNHQSAYINYPSRLSFHCVVLFILIRVCCGWRWRLLFCSAPDILYFSIRRRFEVSFRGIS